MIYLELFLAFLEIGTVSFGGGYAMIPLIREIILSKGWIDEGKFVDLIAVSESTPGPIAVNMATFIGHERGGVAGAALATIGVVLPAFLIILTIAALLKGLMKYKGVEAFLRGVRPVTVGLIIGAAITMGIGIFIGFSSLDKPLSIDYYTIAIFASIAAISFALKKISGKKPSPIVLIVISAIFGMVLYSI